MKIKHVRWALCLSFFIFSGGASAQCDKAALAAETHVLGGEIWHYARKHHRNLCIDPVRYAAIILEKAALQIENNDRTAAKTYFVTALLAVDNTINFPSPRSACEHVKSRAKSYRDKINIIAANFSLCESN